jgi:hypothetical protein
MADIPSREREERAMPKSCNVCTGDAVMRERIETAMASGQSARSLSWVTRHSRYSPDAIERHWRNHVAPEIRVGNSGPGVSPVVLAGGMAELIEEAREVRLHAADSGAHALRLRAIQVEASVRTLVADRLGITADRGRAELEELVALRAAVEAVAVRDPDAAELVASQLSLEHPAAADRIRARFLKTNAGALTT